MEEEVAHLILFFFLVLEYLVSLMELEVELSLVET